jgi:hypothetical protein
MIRVESCSETQWLASSISTKSSYTCKVFYLYLIIDSFITDTQSLILSLHLYLLHFNRLYLDDSLSLQDRWMVTMMIYGAQSDEFDYHKVEITPITTDKQSFL